MNFIAFQSAQLTITKLYERIRHSIFNSSYNTLSSSIHQNKIGRLLVVHHNDFDSKTLSPNSLFPYFPIPCKTYQNFFGELLVPSLAVKNVVSPKSKPAMLPITTPMDSSTQSVTTKINNSPRFFLLKVRKG